MSLTIKRKSKKLKNLKNLYIIQVNCIYFMYKVSSTKFINITHQIIKKMNIKIYSKYILIKYNFIYNSHYIIIYIINNKYNYLQQRHLCLYLIIEKRKKVEMKILKVI